MAPKSFSGSLNPLDSYSHAEFIPRYRIIRHMFIQLLEDISGKLHRSTARCHSIPPVTQLAVALQFLATETFQTVATSTHEISQTSVSRCVTAVSEALTLIAPACIKFPNKFRQRVIQEYFLEKYAFPLVFGCIDGSHVAIVAPSANEDVYVNRKGFHSINVQAICDHEFRFINAVVKWPGCTHDAFIWRQSGIHRKVANAEIETVNGWILGDSVYRLPHILMTPITYPTIPGERRYNRAFCKVGQTIECTFGIWKSRWRSLQLIVMQMKFIFKSNYGIILEKT